MIEERSNGNIFQVLSSGTVFIAKIQFKLRHQACYMIFNKELRDLLNLGVGNSHKKKNQLNIEKSNFKKSLFELLIEPAFPESKGGNPINFPKPEVQTGFSISPGL